MEIRSVPTATIVVLPERFDTRVAHDIEMELTGIANECPGDIICDFSGTKYISSAGLRALFVIQKRLKAKNARIAGFGVSPYVREVFEISGFYRIIPLYESESAALAGSPPHS